MSALNYNRTPGMGDLPGDNSNPNSPDYDNESDERRDEAIEALLADPDWRARHKDAADEYADGAQDGGWYSDAERALADLDAIHPGDLLDSDALTRLYRLARSAARARDVALRGLAEAEIDRQEAA